MILHLGKFTDVHNYMDFTELFDGIVDDSTTKEELLEEFHKRVVLLIYDKGDFCGMVSMDPYEEEYIDAHIFLLPSKRKLSVKVMRYVIDVIQRVGKVPLTSVSSDYPHIKRCLELLGLRVLKVEQNTIIKKGQEYSRIFMIYNKEKPL